MHMAVVYVFNFLFRYNTKVLDEQILFTNYSSV